MAHEVSHSTNSADPSSTIDTITISDLSRTFGRVYALYRVSMTLHAGQVTALLGNNGAGKTTLLNILATLDKPSSGTINYGCSTWRSFASYGRRHIGWVSHDMLVYDELTGRENLLFFAQMYRLNHIEQRVDAWLTRIGLSAAANKRVAAYSRGMRQRLTIARALIHNPRIILFDEPMTGLDQQGIQDVLNLIIELKNNGKIIVLITHDLHHLPVIADRLAILKQGELCYFGDDVQAHTIHQLYAENA